MKLRNQSCQLILGHCNGATCATNGSRRNGYVFDHEKKGLRSREKRFHLVIKKASPHERKLNRRDGRAFRPIFVSLKSSAKSRNADRGRGSSAFSPAVSQFICIFAHY